MFLKGLKISTKHSYQGNLSWAGKIQYYVGSELLMYRLKVLSSRSKKKTQHFSERGAHGGTGYLSMDERYYSRRGRLCEFLKPELNFIERNPRTASTLLEKNKMTSQLRFD